MADNTLIIGSGSCAIQTAAHLTHHGLNVILASESETLASANPKLVDQVKAEADEILMACRLISCNGGIGAFSVQLSQKGRTLQRKVAFIVIAEDNDRRSNIPRYGLLPSHTITDLTTFKQKLRDDTSLLNRQTIALINGLAEENTPTIFGEMTRAALKAKKRAQARAYFLTNNLKVAGDGLEVLYRDAKAAGVVFFKLTKPSWRIQPTDTGGTTIEFEDELAGQPSMISADITVVDETITPSAYLQHLSKELELHCNPSGFLQTENTHRLPVYTNRKGIMVAGPSRAAVTSHDAAADAAAAAGAVIALQKRPADPYLPTANIDTGTCVRCLTCLRLCPFRAVDKGTHISVVQAACEGCGICVAECPRGAISIDADWAEPKSTAAVPPAAKAKNSITAFCCSRSAILALELARNQNRPLPDQLTIVEVPCAGGISLQHLLAAFAWGASGVVVLGCHEGNCHSEIGTSACRNRVKALSDRLTAVGIDRRRLSMANLAAQMSHEAIDILNQFSALLRGLDE